MEKTTTGMTMLCQENTGLDGKKLYTLEEWVNKFRH